MAADTMRLIAAAGAAALTDLTAGFRRADVDADVLSAINGCAGLRRLSLHNLSFDSGTFIAFCLSVSMRRLQHLELVEYYAAEVADDAVGPPDADGYRAAFSALEQLHSLTLENACSIDVLQSQLNHASALRILSIRCVPDNGSDHSSMPSRGSLRALLTPAPHLEVRLLLPATFEGWLALGHPTSRMECTQQWHELHRVVAELESDRVTIVYDETPFD